MKDYNKMMETVKALREAFGTNEFTSRDYVDKIEKENYEVYCSTVVFKNGRNSYKRGNELERDRYMVKVTRTEDFVAKDSNGKKYVGTRYYYEVNDNFMEDLKKDLAKEIDILKEEIENANRQIEAKQKRIAEKEEMIKVFKEIMKQYKGGRDAPFMLA